jgi:cell division protein FtsQ
MTAQQLESTDRFLRPPDVERTLRNYRRIQMQRLFALGRSAAILVAILIGIAALYRHTQSDGRFAVRHVEIVGAVHTPHAALQTLVRRYIGMNLFRLDIARVHADLGALAWIKTIEIEKKLPDTLRIRVTERAPAALIERDGSIRYVDAEGVEFAELSPEVGDADLPLITNASGSDVLRCVVLIRELRARDPQVYARVSEVRPLPPRAFALFDRQLGAFVYANEEDVFSKWRALAAVARAEHFGRGEIAYTDIRFADRLVVKPLHEIPLPEMSRPQFIPSQITN